MSTDDEFRKQAADAQGMADRAISPLDKEAWLRIAQGWLGLIRNAKPRADNTFNAEADKHGTGQDESGSSH